MADTYTPMQTGFVRVFLTKRGARADRTPEYHNCMVPQALEQAYGDVEKIECPHPTRGNEYIEVGSIRGAEERPTTSIIGRYPSDIASILKEFADLKCDHDYQFNIGLCNDVSVFNLFDKKLIFEDGPITNYATDDLGSLSSDGRAEVNETADISGKRWYEVLPLKMSSKAGDIITNELIDVVICDTASCGDCDDPSDGCDKIFALSTTAGGSPSTPADIVYSTDGGTTWLAVDIDTLGAAEAPSALACIGEYVVVVASGSNSLHYALKSDFDSTPAVTWTEVSTGFVANAEPNDIWSVGTKAFICGNGGYIYTCTDPTAGVTVLDAGVAVTDDLNAIHAASDKKFIAVGNSGSIVKSEDGTSVAEVTPRPVGAGVHLTAIWIKANDDDEWFVGTNGGDLYYTVNNGVGFTTATFTGSGSGQVRDIAFASKSVGYMSHDTTAPAGRIFRTYDGGKSWVTTPDQSSANLPANDRITALAACESDINMVVGVGLADDASDGIILLGKD